MPRIRYCGINNLNLLRSSLRTLITQHTHTIFWFLTSPYQNGWLTFTFEIQIRKLDCVSRKLFETKKCAINILKGTKQTEVWIVNWHLCKKNPEMQFSVAECFFTEPGFQEVKPLTFWKVFSQILICDLWNC